MRAELNDRDKGKKKLLNHRTRRGSNRGQDCKKKKIAPSILVSRRGRTPDVRLPLRNFKKSECGESGR